MFDESREFTESVYWFLNKSATEKAKIIEDPGSLEEEEKEKFFRIVGEVRKALATHSKDDVIKELEKLGFGAFALALVEKILAVVPPIEYSVKILNTLDRDDFLFCANEYIENCYLGSYDNGRKIIVNRVGEDVFTSIENLYYHILQGYLSGGLNLNEVSEVLKDAGLDDGYNELVIKAIKDHEVELLRKLIYSQVLTINTNIRRLEDQYKEIVSILQELLKMLKAHSSPPSEIYR